MPIETLKFYDPLYEGIFFKKERRGMRQEVFGSKGPSESAIGLRAEIPRLIETYEMSRLNFIRQAGLAWLVFPSATYTRFSHSLGTYHLGELACRGVNIGTSERNKLPLGRWLKKRKLVDEFLISLLLHDVGHFPFSRTLEENQTLEIPSHEEIVCSFIQADLDNVNEADDIKEISILNYFTNMLKKRIMKQKKRDSLVKV